MTTQALAAIAKVVAATPAVRAPAASGFGVDLACTDDLTPTGATASGQRAVAEALYRRLTTRRGGLIGDPNYGYDLADIINDDVTNADIARHVAMISAECEKDERVQSVSVSQSFIAGVMTIGISIITAAGPFQLVLAISQATVQILRTPT